MTPTHQAEGANVNDRPIVLFLCTHNAGRSVAARVLLDHYAEGRVEVLSAGSAPGDKVNPAVVQILTERGLDASKEFPKPITDGVARWPGGHREAPWYGAEMPNASAALPCSGSGVGLLSG